MASYRDRCREKSSAITDFKKVYLDTKYWVILRDVHRGICRDKEKVELYDLVMRLSESENVIFPFSEVLFEEFLKQTDPESLESTLHLVYKLSKNTAICNYSHRNQTELEIMFRFLHDNISADNDYNVICTRDVWTCVPYAWGKFTVKESKPDDVSYDKKLQNVLFNNDMALKVHLEQLRSDSEFVNSYPDPSEKILQRQKHSNGKHINKILEDEFFFELKERKKNVLQSMSNTFKSFTVDNANSMFYQLIEMKKSGELKYFIPSINIYSTICATWIISQNKKIIINDHFDMMHASAALPYFDMFLTEKSLCHLLNSIIPKHLPFINAKVCADISYAIEELSKIE
ncbi:hypothetical protein [Shewanella algae]|uniref:hypothetical protein n=1 Tax=Shewanella algae TaxID=38313 RepID=UPI001AAC71EB|nr:hypothetical protein [Shewanella algae]MBO2624519.1 hypothetical protein [Shewanella algae]